MMNHRSCRLYSVHIFEVFIQYVVEAVGLAVRSIRLRLVVMIRTSYSLVWTASCGVSSYAPGDTICIGH